jgi:hypothetical protein
LLIKALDLDWIRIRIGVHPKMLDPDPEKMNTDPQPCQKIRKFLLFPFPHATAQLRGDVLTNRQSGDKKIFLSAITAPTYIGSSNYLLNQRRQMNALKNPQI